MVFYISSARSFRASNAPEKITIYSAWLFHVLLERYIQFNLLALHVLIMQLVWLWVVRYRLVRHFYNVEAFAMLLQILELLTGTLLIKIVNA